MINQLSISYKCQSSIGNSLIQEVDILFCRNVLMYFSEAQVRDIINRYHKILNDNGWLIVAPSESLFLNKTEFISTNIDEIFTIFLKKLTFNYS